MNRSAGLRPGSGGSLIALVVVGVLIILPFVQRPTASSPHPRGDGPGRVF